MGSICKKAVIQGRASEEVESSMATDEPFFWVLAGPLIPSHDYGESKELGPWLECFASPKQYTGGLAKQHSCCL